MRALVAQPAAASSESVSETHQRPSTALQRKTPAAQAQRKLAHLIDTSPRLTAQVQRRAAIFGATVQKKPPHHLPHAPEEDELHQLKAAPNRTGLPDNLKAGVESLSGLSLDHVKVHYNSSKPAQLNALAYAQGCDIHVAPGQEKHLPHEAWHVVQQAQGRVKPTRQMKGGVAVNDDAGLEREADVMGARALQMRHSGKSPFEFPFHEPGSAPVDFNGLTHLRLMARDQVQTQQETTHAAVQGKAIQRQIDKDKLNVVGEDHSAYDRTKRQEEESKVTAVFGVGTYYTEDTFSAMPDIASEGATPDDKDKLQNFASKADPPYYAITQGLTFIKGWCDEFRTYRSNNHLIRLINAAHARIEKEMESEPLKKLEDSEKERDFVLKHDTLLSRIEIIEDPSYPQVNLKGRDIDKEVRNAVEELGVATSDYLSTIEANYAQAKAEYESFMGIAPDTPLIKKRSVTMGFHAMAHALGEKKGVLKVGEYHLHDFSKMDLRVTLSTDKELHDFLSKMASASSTSPPAAHKSGLQEKMPGI